MIVKNITLDIHRLFLASWRIFLLVPFILHLSIGVFGQDTKYIKSIEVLICLNNKKQKITNHFILNKDEISVLKKNNKKIHDLQIISETWNLLNKERIDSLFRNSPNGFENNCAEYELNYHLIFKEAHPNILTTSTYIFSFPIDCENNSTQEFLKKLHIHFQKILN